MKILLSLLVLQVSLAFAAESFPTGPHPELTPGELCTRPDTYRYPERIAYCERDVSSETKDDVFLSYRRIGYTMPSDRRSSYKIDHYIPLCAGGSNGVDNLWPQHLTIGRQTDFIEDLGCQMLAKGKITQAELIGLIKRAKNDLSEASNVLRILRNL
jgi:hypothetical protein